MEIKLERNISVESYEAIMKIASFNEKYGYILPVLKLEEEGGITAEQVNTKLFNQKPDHLMGNRLLDRIAKYRLIEQYHGTFKQTAVAETLTVHYNSSHIVSYNSSHIVSYNSSHIVSDYHLT
ncbi:MAG: hypothetical protein U9N38_05740, partial [Thermodesulfobacteriota bacterium]|nr:hypothetical protein [Thermodesulfobacteriota bacterium]